MKLWKNLITCRSALTSYHFHKRLKGTAEAERCVVGAHALESRSSVYFSAGHFLRGCSSYVANYQMTCTLYCLTYNTKKRIIMRIITSLPGCSFNRFPSRGTACLRVPASDEKRVGGPSVVTRASPSL